MSSLASKRRLCLLIARVTSEHPYALRKLMREYGSLAAVLEEPEHAILSFLGDRGVDGPLPGDDVRARPDRVVVTYADPYYPSLLRDIADPPAALFVTGARANEALKALGERPLVAVVGARNPTRYGLEMATSIAGGLAAAGVCVVSGMAMGIDAAAQQAALTAGRSWWPASVGVLGCGAADVYPRSNERLFATMLERGLLLSEYGWHAPARVWRFPARNRIIAGLAHAVVIVEGSFKSGSLSTAEFAVETGREVFAVPGEAGRPLSAAPHKLLRAGAALCESALDVLSELHLLAGEEEELSRSDDAAEAGARGDFSEATSDEVRGLIGAVGDEPRPLPAATSDELCGLAGSQTTSDPRRQALARVLTALEREECTIDQLAVEAHLSAAAVTTLATELEIEGLIERVGGGRLRRVRAAAAHRPPAAHRLALAHPEAPGCSKTAEGPKPAASPLSPL